jgi:hypothetical protein
MDTLEAFELKIRLECCRASIKIHFAKVMMNLKQVKSSELILIWSPRNMQMVWIRQTPEVSESYLAVPTPDHQVLARLQHGQLFNILQPSL